jgi:protein phosphatase
MFFLRKNRRKLARIPADRLHIRAIVRTDAGCVRRNNEDNAGFIFIEGSKTRFAAFLADGMGGYEGGEVASGIMADAFYEDNGRTMGKNPRRWLSDMFHQVNSRIYKYALQQEMVMGTTCSMLLIQEKKVWYAHAGDSRIYLLAEGRFRQLTSDHTVVGEMMRRSRLTAEEARTHPQRSVLTKALGTGLHVEPDISRITCPVRAGDRFLLCSDGLYDLVPDSEIHRLLALPSLKAVATSLVSAAKAHGGYDNITVVIVEINEKTNTKNDEPSDI